MTPRASRPVAPPRVVGVEDLRRLARRRVPRAVFDYIDGGAEGEVTRRENCRAFEDVTFRPRQAVAVAGCDLRTLVLGLDLALPFVLAPVGYSRLMSPGGEVAAARAAGQAGTGYVLSTISGHRLEDVQAASAGPSSTSSTSWAGVPPPRRPSIAPGAPGSPGWSSPSTPPSPRCASGTTGTV
jgi:hypothetical protein